MKALSEKLNSSLCKRQVLHILIINIKRTIGTLEKFPRSFRSNNRDNEINATFSNSIHVQKLHSKCKRRTKWHDLHQSSLKCQYCCQ